MANESSNFTATASSQYSVDYPPSKVLDGSIGGLPWASQTVSGTFNEWLKFTHITSARIKEFKYYPETSRVKAWVLAGSNNDSDYTTLNSGEDDGSKAWKTVSVGSPNDYKYYRFTITTFWEPGSSQVAIFECELWQQLVAGGNVMLFGGGVTIG